ncbi:TPA: phage tail spike protein [Streptococcus pneumoniae]
MLYLLNKDVRTVRWNGEPLHESTSAIVKETMNGDFTLTVKYPISDSGIYQLIKEDMLIKAPTPVLGAQLFRIKKPVEHNDHLEITAYHISDDVMQRSITPMSVTSQSCGMALSRMVQNTKTALGDFSFNSDIQDRRTFNTTETETLYSVLLDGKHSIVGTWEGELVRDNFALTVKKSRGENRGVVITTHKNLKDYQRTRSSQNVVTRIHAKSKFKPEGAEKETTIRVTVDSPLINSYPYINEKEYENNNAKSVEELQKWAQAKFSNEGIDKVSDAIKIEAYELDGQVVNMGDTVNLKSWKHNVDAFKKAIAYEFDALKEEYISLTFDDKAGNGGSKASGGLSSAADAILGVTESVQEIALEKALQNADLDFDHKVGSLRQEISDGIELARARAEEVKRELSDTIDQRFSSFNNGSLQEIKRRIEEALQNAGASTLLAQEAKRIGLDSIAKLEAFKSQAMSAQMALSSDLDALKQTIANDIRPKQAQTEAEIEKQVKALIQTKNELAGVKSAQATYEETTTRRLAELTNLANGKASKSELTQTAEELASKIASVKVGGVNLLRNTASLLIGDRSKGYWMSSSGGNGRAISVEVLDPPKKMIKNMIRVIENTNGGNKDLTQLVRLRIGEKYTISCYARVASDSPNANVNLLFRSWANDTDLNRKFQKSISHKNWQKYSFTFTADAIENSIQFGQSGAGIIEICAPKIESGTLATDYSESPEDTSAYISAVESNFRQRADALDAGVSRLTEGLRTKADISALNVTAENIRQSVKSLETDTQNKLNQKLSTAEFDVRASGIRQEILNATKDKADRALVTAEAGKLREELASQVGSGRNLWINSKIAGNPVVETLPAGHITGQKQCYKLTNNQELSFNIEPDFSSRLFRKVTFSAWIKYENVVKGANAWNGFNCFKHYLFLKNSQTGATSSASYLTMATFEGTSDWKRIVFTYDYSSNKGYDQLKTILRFNLENVRSGTAWITGIQVEFGGVANEYAPALEDVDSLITEAKASFERTAQGLRTDLTAVQDYVNKDGQRQETLQRYAREESAKQATSVRELVTRDFVGKASYQEDVRAIERKFEAITNPQNGSIATQIANYKTAVDGRFTEITSMISGKANQTDFQRVRETSQLYERILGNTNNSIVDNVARMAMTSQLFQVEVAKASASGRNLFLNSLFKRDLRDKYSTYKLFDDVSQTKGQLAVSIDSENQFRGVNTLKIVSTFSGKTDNQKITFAIGGNGRTGRVDELKNKSARFSFWAKSTVNNTNFQARAGYRGAVKGVSLTTDWQFFDIEFIRNENSNATSELILHVFSNATVWIAFPKIEIGTVATPFSEAPEDTDEAIRSVQSQLAGSWAVQNLTSAGALVSGLNLGANGHNRLDGKLTHITGETLIDKAVIKSAMVDKLKTANFEAGSVTTVVLDAEAVTAEKLKVDQALFNKLVANEAYLSQLFAKQAFINRVQSVAIDASQVRSGILSGDRIYGGTIRGANIFGGTLTGHTKIQLGSYGSFDTVNGGLQINVPRDYNAKDGLGVQFIGSYGRGENVPYGLFLYRDSDFTIGNTATDTDEFLMTVQGYINAKGIGWLKTGKGSVNGKTTGTIGLWNSDNVSLSFGGSGNDIYYSYNSTAYSLWSVVNQHFSDRRLKENIVECKHKALDYIQQFQFKEYDWKKQEDRPRQAHTKIGLIAQEVQAVDPTLVYENGDTLNLDNLRLTNIALKAIQELALENKKLTQRLENLENERRTA